MYQFYIIEDAVVLAFVPMQGLQEGRFLSANLRQFARIGVRNATFMSLLDK